MVLGLAKRDEYLFDKQIRIITEHIKGENNRRVIGILSGKGGVGKTVVALNLGLAISELGSDVTLVDADTTAPNLGLHMGEYSFPACLQDVLNEKSTLENATYSTSAGIKIIPSSIAIESIGFDVEDLQKHLKSLSGIVLVDSPPGIDSRSPGILQACDELIIVATPDLPSAVNAAKAVEIAKKMNRKVLGILINRHRNDSYDLSPQEIETITESTIIGKIPEEPEMRKSIFFHTPILFQSPYSDSSIEFRRLAARLTNKDYQPPRFAKVRKLLHKIRRK